MRKPYSIVASLALLLSSATLRAQITTYPDITDFESETLCGTSCTGACNIAIHWRNADQYGFAQAGTDWLTDEGGTPSTATGPDVDHTVGSATGNYVYTETSGCNNISAHLVSGIYDFSALTAPRIEFWGHFYGATMGNLFLDVDSTGLGTNWMQVGGPWTGNVNTWQKYAVDLTAFAGETSVRIRFRSQTGSSFTSDMAIDDIKVFQPEPYDLQAVNVSAGGNCGNSPTTPIEVTFSQGGFDTIPAGDTLFFSTTANGNTFLDTLILTSPIGPGDTITYILQNGTADLSGPSAIAISSTVTYSSDPFPGDNTSNATALGVPVISTYPYYEDFESGVNGWRATNGTAGSWAFGTPAKTVIIGAASGVNAWTTGGLTGDYQNSDNSWVDGPCFDLSTLCDPVIEMKVWWNAEFSWDGMNITASSDGGQTWQLVGAVSDPFNWYTDNSVAGNPGGYQSAWSGRTSTSNGSNGWVTVKHRLNGFAGAASTLIRINFGSDGSVVDDGTAFDDVRIYDMFLPSEDMTVCSPPQPASANYSNGNASSTYNWSSGATTSSITFANTGTYTVTMTDGGTCTHVDSFFVSIVDSNTVVSLGPDSNYCGLTTLDAGFFPGAIYTWSNGDSTQMATADTTNMYTVIVDVGCAMLYDTANIVVNPLPSVDAGLDAMGCDSVTLTATISAGSIMWSTGGTTASIVVGTSGSYSVMAMDSSGCSASDTVMAMVYASPVVDLGPDTVLCNNATITLDAGNAGATYAWSNASTNQTISVSAAGTYSVVVTDSNTCSGTDAVVVTTGTSPGASPTATPTGGYGFSFTSGATGSPTTYAWNFGDGNTSTQANPTHTYASTPGNYTVTLVVTNDCGSETQTINLTVTSTGSSLDAGYALYPNPAKDWVTLTALDGVIGDVRMMDMAGRVMRSYSSEQMAGGSLGITLSGLASGQYIIEVQSEGRVQRLRLSVQQ